MSSAPGREPVTIVEIKQPLCSRTYGVAPCTATGDPEFKCYNTRATCQDVVNFALGTPLSLFFSSGRVAERGVSGAPYIIPSLLSVSSVPARINFAGINPNAKGIGDRATCTITFADHPHTDRVVDPYLSDRTWNPLDGERGSFWSRWRKRNLYRQQIEVVVYEGYAGQALSAMVSRTYFMESLSGPTSSGRVTVQCKDILAQIEERKAQAPRPSPGVLYAPINESQTSFEVAGAVEADYQSSGTVRIGDEIMTYASRATSANGILFSGVVRGTDNTTAQEHDFDAAVQECLRVTNERFDSVLGTLLQDFSDIDPTWLDTTGWAGEASEWRQTYRLNAVVTEPRGVIDLVSEILEQCSVYMWWDERAKLVKIKAIRGVDTEPPLLTEESHIVAGSVGVTEMPREWVSRVYIHYNQTDFTKSSTDPSAYESLFALVDAEQELAYGDESIKTIYARWLNAGALAENTASKIVTRFSIVPQQISFTLDAKDRSYWLGDTVRIRHHLFKDEYGQDEIRNWTIIEAEEREPGHTVTYVAEDTTLYGAVFYVAPSGQPDYTGANPNAYAFIGDAGGFLSDGSRAGTIS